SGRKKRRQRRRAPQN
nr:Chain B, Tat [Human immunodeficiency virus 1]